MSFVLMLISIALIGMVVSSCFGEGRIDSPLNDPDRQAERDRMVDEYIIPSGITDPAVIATMRRVPRHRFIPATEAGSAYADYPLPIGHGQTISQPSLVAMMTEALTLRKTDKVLEVGTGSGYQTAILAELVDQVLTVEILKPLSRRAAQTLAALNYKNVRVQVRDGYQGWPEEAPFDAIIVTAAADQVPQALLDQLVVGGRLIVPVGRFFQTLELYYRRGSTEFERKSLTPVRFVPLVHEGEKEK